LVAYHFAKNRVAVAFSFFASVIQVQTRAKLRQHFLQQIVAADVQSALIWEPIRSMRRLRVGGYDA
jgi:hypothetical protein